MATATGRPDRWETVRARLEAWWRRDGLVLHVVAPRDGAWGAPFAPELHFPLTSGLDPGSLIAGPVDLETAWLDADRRVEIARAYMARTYHGAEAFPCFDPHLGPGSLATFLGSIPEFAPDTVWFAPDPAAPAEDRPLRFDPSQPWFARQTAIVEAGARAAAGRFLVAMPDLIENLDTLAALRGTEAVMTDLLERPALVKRRLREINRAWFDAFERLYRIVMDPRGGNAYSAFKIWGPGRTATVQCDASAMISCEMFDAFVKPVLTEQCAWLDYSLYHLDGPQAVRHLDAVLAIDALDAVEWTPGAAQPGGGDPVWFALYRRILEAGKSLQVIDVKPHELGPLLDAIGARGVFVMTTARSEAEARAMEEVANRYR